MIRLLPILLLALLLVRPAHAQSLEDLLTGLTYDDPKAAIQMLAAANDDKAKAATAALARDALFVRIDDNAVVIAEKDGAQYVITNALTGEIEAMAAAEELRAIAVDEETRRLLGAAATPVAAGPFDFAAGVRAVQADSFTEKGKAIDRLTDLGDTRAIPVFQALADGRLFSRRSDSVVVIGDRSGNDLRLTLAETLAPAGIAAPSELECNAQVLRVAQSSSSRMSPLS